MLQESYSSYLLLFAIPITISFLVGVILIYINYARSVSIQKKLRSNYFFHIENEKIKISRELHDAVTPFTLPLKEFIKKRGSFNEENEKDWLEDINRFETYLSKINDNLFPAELLEGDLCEAIKNLTKKTYNEDVKIEFYAEKLPPILKSNVVQIYRIIQESLINAVKYSQSSLINLVIVKQKNNLCVFISYENNSKKNIKQSHKKFRRGHKIIKQRLELLSGKQEVEIVDNTKTEKFIFNEIFL